MKSFLFIIRDSLKVTKMNITVIVFISFSLASCAQKNLSDNSNSMGEVNFIQNRVLGKYERKTNKFIPADTSFHTSNFVEGICTIRRNNQYGIIDTNGIYISEINQKIHFFDLCSEIGTLQVSPPSVYQPINSVCDGGFAGTYIVCDRKGNIIVPYILANTHEPITINSDFKFIYLIRNDTISKKDGLFNDEICKRCGLCLGNKGIINCKGEIVCPFDYTYIGQFNESLASVSKGFKNGFIDSSGLEIIPCHYDGATKFDLGLASVKLNGRWGMIDQYHNIVIPIVYDFFIEFKNDKAKVSKDGVPFYINRNGEKVE